MAGRTRCSLRPLLRSIVSLLPPAAPVLPLLSMWLRSDLLYAVWVDERCFVVASSSFRRFHALSLSIRLLRLPLFFLLPPASFPSNCAIHPLFPSAARPPVVFRLPLRPLCHALSAPLFVLSLLRPLLALEEALSGVLSRSLCLAIRMDEAGHGE